jgi:thymidylate kinase
MITYSELKDQMGTTQPNLARTLLADIFAALEEQGMPYCVMGGYENFPYEVTSDVDLMLPIERACNLSQIAAQLAGAVGARMVQAQDHRTGSSFTLCRGTGDQAEIFLLDLSHTCGDRGAVWVSSHDIFAGRQYHVNGFWVPAPAHAFAYYLGKRAYKGSFSLMQIERLLVWMEADPAGCRSWMSRWFSPALVTAIEDAVQGADTDALHQRSTEIVRQLRRGSVVSRPHWQLQQVARLIRRMVSPIGMSIVFLGPDGCGKSTVGNHALATAVRAFRGLDRYHLRPRPSKGAPVAPVTDPYGKAPRSFVQSVAKLGYFLAEYTAGYFRFVRPALVRNRLVAFDRFYCDLLADPRRYRFGAPMWMAHLVGRLIPQPDLYIVLDAPAEVLQARKQEVSPEQSAQQRQAYLDIAATLPNAVIVDAARPLDRVVADVIDTIFATATARTARRLGIADRNANSRPHPAQTPAGGR